MIIRKNAPETLLTLECKTLKTALKETLRIIFLMVWEKRHTPTAGLKKENGNVMSLLNKIQEYC